MDVETLLLLTEISKYGSFAAVARRHETDPSRISRLVAAAEAELGLRLFHRSTRSLTVTEAGAAYLDRIALLLDELDAAANAARNLTTDPGGTLRLTASPAYAEARLIPALAEFRVRAPQVSLDLLLTETNLDLIGDRIDLAIRLAPVPAGDLVCRRLHPTQYRVCAAPRYLENTARPACPEDLSHLDAVLLDLPDYRSAWRYRRNGTEAGFPVSGPIRVSTPTAQRAAMLAGHGVALMADWMIVGDLAEGRCVDLFPDFDFAATSFDTSAWLLYPDRRYLPAKTRLMIDHLVNQLGRT